MCGTAIFSLLIDFEAIQESLHVTSKAFIVSCDDNVFLFSNWLHLRAEPVWFAIFAEPILLNNFQFCTYALSALTRTALLNMWFECRLWELMTQT